MNLSRATSYSLAFVLCCLLSSARLLVNAPSPTKLRSSADEIPNRSDRRFATIKTMLPHHGVIGYVGESGPAGTSLYYLTQYALAPLVVDRSTQHAIVVGNFPKLPPTIPPDGLRLVKDFGDGVLLLAAKDAK